MQDNRNIIRLGMQHFAGEAPEGEEPSSQAPRTYTQEEVEALLQKEGDKRVTEALKKAEKKKSEAVREAQRLAQMGADEKFQYELEQREKAIAEKEHQLALAENKNEAGKLLAEKGISLKLVDFVVAEDADTMMGNITLLEKEFKASVKAEVERRLASSTPKKNLPAGEGLTRERFRKMSLAEQQELFIQNPELYKQLSGITAM